MLGFLLVLMGSMHVIGAVLSREANPLWWLGLSVGILEILLAMWVSQQFYDVRGALILLWVGFMAIFRGISEVVMAFELHHAKKQLDIAPVTPA